MGSSPREECLRRHRGWSRNETVRGLSATRRARAAKRDGGCGSHKAPRVPQRAAGMPQPRACHKRREPWPEDRPPAGTTSPRSDRTTRRGIPASAMRRGLRDSRRTGTTNAPAEPTSRHGPGPHKRASRQSDSVPLACTASAADRNRGTRRRAGTTVPRLGTRQRLAQRCLPSGALAPVNAPARAPTNAPLACPKHFGRGTTRVPRPAIQLRAARSFSARPHTPR